MVDYKHFDPKFDNSLEKVGPEFSELEEAKDKFARENRGRYVPVPKVTKNIAGLVPRMGRVPATRNWIMKTGSFERNGFFNVHTHVLNTKFLYASFMLFLVWGWV
mmetsp:Transcript_15011/g.23629  ORF Transcript_15011/g.23629 Transcript_15011/m.23629 type:complete len:105 (+) Transcript_15011:34-348(+)